MNYSRLDMIGKRGQVFEANNSFQFAMRWIKNMSGKGTLYISLPQMSKENALQICRTVRRLSSRSFSLSSLVAYQMDEVLKDQELNPNLYSLKKNLIQIEDTPHNYIATHTKQVEIHLLKTSIYKLEFLLANMSSQLGKHEMTVEKLIQFTLMDLLREIAHGRAENTVQTILDSLGVSKKSVNDYVKDKGEELLA